MPYTTLPSGHRIHYTDYAPDSNDGSDGTTTTTAAAAAKLTLILVHGLGSTQNYYFPIVAGLNRRGFRCVVFDNWLAGRSVPVDEQGWSQVERQGIGATSVEKIAGDVLALMDALRIEKGVVVGYSMGGMLPTYLAATAPTRVVAGVCIGPVHPSAAVADVFKQRVPVVQEGGIETMANTIPHRAVGASTTPLQKSFIREMILAQDPRGYIANCRAIEHATPPEYGKVKCPVLIIAGDEDKSAPLEGCKYIFGELATEDDNKRLEVLNGTGHWHCVERGQKVEELVGGWCEGLL